MGDASTGWIWAVLWRMKKKQIEPTEPKGWMAGGRVGGRGRGAIKGWGVEVQTVGCKTGYEVALYNMRNIANIL